MSTYVLMKILESAPQRYDKGIRILTLGMVDKAYDRLLDRIRPHQKVLDIGCGTGALTLRAAQKNARVKAIDVNSQMLEIAQARATKLGLQQNIEFCEMGAAELGSENSDDYDVVMSGLCFSELSDNEQAFALKEIIRILKPGGEMLIADEVVPNNIFKRLVHWLIKLPLIVVTYLISQATTRAVKGLPQKVAQTGFAIESIRCNTLGAFMELVAKKPERNDQ